MIVVRNCFIAKPGMASKLAAQFKEAAATDAPEASEISCSELRPPERTATRMRTTSLTSIPGRRCRSGRSGGTC